MEMQQIKSEGRCIGKAGEQQIRLDSEVSYVLQLFSELQALTSLLNSCRNQARISNNLFMDVTDTLALGQ